MKIGKKQKDNRGQQTSKRRGPKKMGVPRIYSEAAKVLKKVINVAELRDTVFKMNHPNVRGIYSLASMALENNELLESILERTGLLNETCNSDLTKILTTELLWGKQKIIGDSKPVKETMKYEKALREALEKASIPVILPKDNRPCYIRINTLLVTINGTIERLKSDGWQLVNTPETYESFLECVSNINSEQFMKDYHFEDVLVFSPKNYIRKHKLVKNGSLLLQDKASCLPALLLDPKPGSVVLDMCAAPGMKTTHLANLMENKGTIFAVDIHQQRFEEMKITIERNCKQHNCVTMKLADSNRLTSKDCPEVQYILVDPSCSGYEMATRKVDEGSTCIASKRIQSLSGFQERLLVQAMTAFPDVQRIVYCTHSLLETENEVVLEKALSRVQCFQVVPPQLKKPWEHRGNDQFPFGSNCLVANMDQDRTNGFFVAVLERIPEMASSFHPTPKKEKSKKRTYETLDKIDDSDEWKVAKKKRKAKKMKSSQDVQNDDGNLS